MPSAPSTPPIEARRRPVAPMILPLLMAWAPAAVAQGPTAVSAIAAPIPGTYRSDRLGLEYRLHPYRGHYGARLTIPPAPGSPLLKMRRPDGSPTYLEPGDMIVTLDDQIIAGPDDVENHVLLTKVTFVNVRTGLPERATAIFPNDAAPARAPVPGPAPAPRPSVGAVESGRVKAVIVVDTATGIDALGGNLTVVRQLLAPLVDAGRCDVTVLQGQDATADRLVETLRGFGDASADTVFVYYTGHGATDVAKGHAFTFKRGRVLLRSEVRQELAALRPRLAVLLSECCSALTVIPMAKMVPAPQAPAGIPADNLSGNVRSLLLRTRGVVDVNSSSCEPAEGLDEYSYVGRNDGLFTAAIGDVLRLQGFDKLDKNRDGLLTWGEALPMIRVLVRVNYLSLRMNILRDAQQPDGPLDDATKDMVQHLRNQPWQTPQAFSLDGPTYLLLTGPAFEPGVAFSSQKVVDPKFGGEVIGDRVDAITHADGPFARTLQLGDVVTAVNDYPSPTPAQMLERLDAIAPLNKIRFFRPGDSKFREVPLADVPAPRPDAAPALAATPASPEVQPAPPLPPFDREE